MKSRTLRDGAPWLKSVLVQSAWAARRNKDAYLRAQFLTIKSRRGPKKAIMEVAASIITAAYHLMREPVPTKNWVRSTCCASTVNGRRHGSPNASAISVMKSKSKRPPNSHTRVSW